MLESFVAAMAHFNGWTIVYLAGAYMVVVYAVPGIIVLVSLTVYGLYRLVKYLTTGE